MGQTSDEVYAEKTDLMPGQVDTEFMLREIIPHADGDAFTVRVGKQDVLDDTVSWEEGQTFTPGTSRKLDFRTSGPVFAIKFSGNGDWRISAYTVDFAKKGTR